MAAVGATRTVEMNNFSFTPADLTINVGDTVTWTVVLGQHDTVSGTTGVPSGVWNSNNQFGRLMRAGETFSVTFNSPGRFPYYCTPHWIFGMTGTITVIAANSPPAVAMLSPANGTDFSAPATINVQASATDADGSVAEVTLTMNGAPIGTFSAPPYSTTVENLGPGNYTFTATARDNDGATASSSVSVTVSGQQPVITNGPESQTVNEGTDVLFTVQATGSAPLNYQWFFGGAALGGATSPTLLLPAVTEANEGTYRVEVSNTFGSVSANATLTVTNPPSGTPPAITGQPESQTVNVGTNVTFTVAAIGSTPLTWQWLFNNSPIAGATNSSLTLSNVTLADSGIYVAVVNNPFGTATSTGATLTVTAPPTCNYALSKNGISFGPAGGLDSVNVITGGECNWSVINTNTWIVIIAGATGTGPGIVSLTVLSNTTLAARTGILLIAGNSLTVTQAATRFVVRADFNRDGHSDFVWQHTDGRVRLWLMEGATNISTLLLRANGRMMAGSKLVGTHDFNQDGNEDILWQEPGGKLQVWFMRATNLFRAEGILDAPLLGRTWQASGIGDFNHDGRSDVVFRHRDGYLLVWLLRGRRFLSQSLLFGGEPIPLEWRLAGTPDMNRDGHSDMVWQGPDQSVVVWFMSDTVPVNGPLLSHLPRPNAELVGFNDANRDGQTDFIWRRSDGRLSIWLMNGTNRTDGAAVTRTEDRASWRFAAPRN